MLVTPTSWGRIKPPPGTQVQRGHPLAKGLAFCMLLNEKGRNAASTVDLRDYAGRQDAYMSSGAAWGMSPYGPAVAFTAASSHFVDMTSVNGTKSYMVITTNEVTLEGIVKVASAPAAGNSGVIQRANSGTRTCSLEIKSTGAPQFELYDGTNNPFVAHGSSIAGDGLYHHLCGVRKGGTIYLYVDGKLSGSAADTAGDLSGGATAQDWQCMYDRISSHFLDGTLVCARVWLRGLTAGDVGWLAREPFAMFDLPPSRPFATSATTFSFSATYSGGSAYSLQKQANLPRSYAGGSSVVTQFLKTKVLSLAYAAGSSYTFTKLVSATRSVTAPSAYTLAKTIQIIRAFTAASTVVFTYLITQILALIVTTISAFGDNVARSGSTDTRESGSTDTTEGGGLG